MPQAPRAPGRRSLPVRDGTRRDGRASPCRGGVARGCVHSAPESVQVFFGEAKADVLAVYMIFAGVWQINVKVPDRAPAGEVAVMVRAGGETSPVALLRIAER